MKNSYTLADGSNSTDYSIGAAFKIDIEAAQECNMPPNRFTESDLYLHLPVYYSERDGTSKPGFTQINDRGVITKFLSWEYLREYKKLTPNDLGDVKRKITQLTEEFDRALYMIASPELVKEFDVLVELSTDRELAEKVDEFMSRINGMRQTLESFSKRFNSDPF